MARRADSAYSWPMTDDGKKNLRRGWTTGACAAAAAKAAFQGLITGRFPGRVSITLPGGQQPVFEVALARAADGAASAGVIKDAGDDPDVTHGATIIATLRHGAADSGVTFKAGAGVGTVTLAGLALAVGEPAINPVPRRMIGETLAGQAAALGVGDDIEVEISVPGGEKIAERTMNGRLGILGGISILGTTGIVVPYSCAAWIASIHQGIDVARAAGITHIAAATGATSEAAAKRHLGLDTRALIDMGDFAGGLLKHLRSHPVARLSIAGGFAKMCKLAQGHLDLHSARSSVDFDGLAGWLAGLGADKGLIEAAKTANTANQILQLAIESHIGLGDYVAGLALSTARGVGQNGGNLDILIFDRQGKLVGEAHE